MAAADDRGQPGARLRAGLLGPVPDLGAAGRRDARSGSTASPSTRGNAQRALDYACEVIPLYEKWFGPYFDTEFEIAPSFFGWNGNECSGLVLLDDRVMRLPTAGRRYIDHLVTHETCHQWWWNVVGTDGYAETFMDEGLVNCFTALRLDAKYGRNGPLIVWPEGLTWLPTIGREDLRLAGYYGWRRKGERGPVIQDLKTMGNLNTLFSLAYDRGGKVVEMIHNRLGDERFFAFFRKLYTDTPSRRCTTPTSSASSIAFDPKGDWPAFLDGWVDEAQRDRLGRRAASRSGRPRRPTRTSGQVTVELEQTRADGRADGRALPLPRGRAPRADLARAGELRGPRRPGRSGTGRPMDRDGRRARASRRRSRSIPTTPCSTPGPTTTAGSPRSPGGSRRCCRRSTCRRSSRPTTGSRSSPGRSSTSTPAAGFKVGAAARRPLAGRSAGRGPSRRSARRSSAARRRSSTRPGPTGRRASSTRKACTTSTTTSGTPAAGSSSASGCSSRPASSSTTRCSTSSITALGNEFWPGDDGRPVNTYLGAVGARYRQNTQFPYWDPVQGELFDVAAEYGNALLGSKLDYARVVGPVRAGPQGPRVVGHLPQQPVRLPGLRGLLVARLGDRSSASAAASGSAPST